MAEQNGWALVEGPELTGGGKSEIDAGILIADTFPPCIAFASPCRCTPRYITSNLHEPELHEYRYHVVIARLFACAGFGAIRIDQGIWFKVGLAWFGNGSTRFDAFQNKITKY